MKWKWLGTEAILLVLVAGSFWKMGRNSATQTTPPSASATDAGLIQQLLHENLDHRIFSFATVAEATSGKKVIPLGERDSHRRAKAAIEAALAKAIESLNAENSPLRSLRRINEASRFFEDALHASLDAEPDLSCGVPPNRLGKAQRSGYPDLRIVHEPTGDVFYLDPKLIEDNAWDSTLRTFYFEPKVETLKITDNAVHLLAGIGHDGHDGAWKFTGFKLVDLSTLNVRLKAEFQASNAEIYPKD
ncbi:hypothetical protein [Luteolibacter soli]|uniref:Uncharacterized protein n=1 Tax=Luteolibacter soli TaxID=3135280 RepID=A0ABU9AQL5_9BACT